MFDFLRKLRQSEANKRQEAITAYLDDELTAGDRQYFEQQMASDRSLRADMEEQRLVKRSISHLPQMRAPRNFTLDPALYGRPAPQTNARLYPAMRAATVLIGIFFVVAVAAEILTFNDYIYSSDTVALNAPASQMLAAEAEMAPAEQTAADFDREPRAGFDSAADSVGAEKAVEEKAPQAAPAEALDAEMTEGLTEVEEAVADESLGEAASPVEEAEAEAAPRTTRPAEAPGEAEAPLAAESAAPSGGGGEPPEAPQPGMILTEVSGRSALAATATARGEPSPAPALGDGETSAFPAVDPEAVAQTAVAEDEATEDLVAEAPDAKDLAEDLPFSEDQQAIPLASEPAETGERSAGLPILRLVILLLGIGLILLAALTLATRWRMKA